MNPLKRRKLYRAGLLNPAPVKTVTPVQEEGRAKEAVSLGAPKVVQTTQDATERPSKPRLERRLGIAKKKGDN